MERIDVLRYYTTLLHKSKQFFREYITSYRLEHYIVYIATEVHDYKFPKEKITKMVHDQYKEKVAMHLPENILFASELKEAIYDENGSFKTLDEDIFFSLRYYASKFNALDYEAVNQVYEAQRAILNGDYHENIKALAKLDKHNCIMGILLNTNHIDIHFSNGSAFKFYLKPNNQYPIVNHEKLKVIDEEIFANADGSFEYNILGRTADAHGNLNELSINFITLDVL